MNYGQVQSCIKVLENYRLSNGAQEDKDKVFTELKQIIPALAWEATESLLPGILLEIDTSEWWGQEAFNVLRGELKEQGIDLLRLKA